MNSFLHPRILPHLFALGGLVMTLACGGGGKTAETVPPPADKGSLALLAGNVDGLGYADGSLSEARFKLPLGIARDAQGNFYVADTYNHTIRKITSAGQVSTLAGSPGQAGATNGTGSAARFNLPKGLAIDAAGNVFVADYGNQLIRKITAAGVVSTYAGTAGVMGATDGSLAQAEFASPFGLVFDSNGNLFVSDLDNGTIRKITTAGQVTTFAGTAQQFGAVDGQGGAAQFASVYFMAIDTQNNLYVADGDNGAIRKITPDGTVSTFAGILGSPAYLDATDKLSAQFDDPYGVAIDASGAILVSDMYIHRIRKILPTGEVTTLSGSDAGMLGGFADGAGKTAKFAFPCGIVTDLSGNAYVADEHNNLLRKVVVSSGVTSTWSGAVALKGAVDGTGSAARFNTPLGIGATSSGNLLVADAVNYTIRQLTPAGEVTTYAGIASTYGSNDGPLGTNTFHVPYSIAGDSSGNTFVADTSNNVIRKISSDKVVTTYSGTASMSGGTSDAPPAYNTPRGVAVDGQGNVWVADTINNTIRRISPTGTVTTVAGSPGVKDFVDGTGVAARFNTPNDLAVDGSGHILIADSANNAIRVLDPATNSVTTLVGKNGTDAAKDGDRTSARFSYPRALSVDKTAGVLYVADRDSNAIRRVVLSSGNVTTVVGVLNLAGVKLGDLPGSLFAPQGVAFLNGKLYITTDNGVVVATPPSTGF